jgi:hypothetical protein
MARRQKIETIPLDAARIAHFERMAPQAFARRDANYFAERRWRARELTFIAIVGIAGVTVLGWSASAALVFFVASMWMGILGELAKYLFARGAANRWVDTTNDDRYLWAIAQALRHGRKALNANLVAGYSPFYGVIADLLFGSVATFALLENVRDSQIMVLTPFATDRWLALGLSVTLAAQAVRIGVEIARHRGPDAPPMKLAAGNHGGALFFVLCLFAMFGSRSPMVAMIVANGSMLLYAALVRFTAGGEDKQREWLRGYLQQRATAAQSSIASNAALRVTTGAAMNGATDAAASGIDSNAAFFGDNKHRALDAPTLAQFHDEAPAALQRRDAGYFAERLAVVMPRILFGAVGLYGVYAMRWQLPAMVLLFVVTVWFGELIDVARNIVGRREVARSTSAWESDARAWSVANALQDGRDRVPMAVSAGHIETTAGFFLDFVFGGITTLLLPLILAKTGQTWALESFLTIPALLGTVIALLTLQALVGIVELSRHSGARVNPTPLRDCAGLRGPGLFVCVLAMALAGDRGPQLFVLIGYGGVLAFGVIGLAGIIQELVGKRWLRTHFPRAER